MGKESVANDRLAITAIALQKTSLQSFSNFVKIKFRGDDLSAINSRILLASACDIGRIPESSILLKSASALACSGGIHPSRWPLTDMKTDDLKFVEISSRVNGPFQLHHLVCR